jgi:hypothetical protein
MKSFGTATAMSSIPTDDFGLVMVISSGVGRLAVIRIDRIYRLGFVLIFGKIYISSAPPFHPRVYHDRRDRAAGGEV